jgi:hypothetical protein
MGGLPSGSKVTIMITRGTIRCRGRCVDQAALCANLRNERISGRLRCLDHRQRSYNSSRTGRPQRLFRDVWQQWGMRHASAEIGVVEPVRGCIA